MKLLHAIGNKPVVAALRNPEDLEAALASPVEHVFIMGGSIMEVGEVARKAKGGGKGVFVHLDLVRGISNADKESVHYMAQTVGVDGIITPKSHLIGEARKYRIYGILHLFIIDSQSLQKALHLVNAVQPDGIEIMPGLVGKTISRFAEAKDIPIIASGLIQTRPEALQALEAGATALSVSEQSLWTLTFDQL